MIRAKIAKVLSEDEYVINKGEADGVTPGMIFDVRDDRLDDIVDPDTGESLGSIDRPRLSIRITRVGDRAALGRRYERSSGWSILGGVQAYRPRGILSALDIEDEVQVGDLALHEGEMATYKFH